MATAQELNAQADKNIAVAQAAQKAAESARKAARDQQAAEKAQAQASS